MIHVLIRHKVKNYSSWKLVFDQFIETRRAGGEIAFSIFHPSEEPNHLFLLFEWDNLANANQFIGSSQLKEAMQEGGVTESPEIQFLETVTQGTTAPAYTNA